MRTWWIVRISSELFIWSYYSNILPRSSLGPYWTYEEAKELLEKWV